MKAPLSWLKEYVDIDVSNKEFADKLTLSGSKVETIEDVYGEISGIVVAKIVGLEKHPDADKLQVTKVDIGTELLQIVTGAQNITLGDVIPVALVGAKLPGGKAISKGKLRGVESFGMMCSIEELALTKEEYPEADENGIFILSKEKSIEKELTLGLDVKELLDLKEVTIEFEITPNRPDCLSIKGLARETALTFNRAFKKLDYSFKEIAEKSEDFATVEIQDELCKRYVGKVIKNVQVGPSPKWMQARLKAAGLRSINNIVDITNYVMLELGQPMHAFDLDKLEGKKIIVRRARENEPIHTLDEEKRTLDTSMLVIADENKAVAVAGVIGGQETKVIEDTKSILFESAAFEGASIRSASKKLGVRTDSSARFEKGLDPNNAMVAIEMAAALIEKLGAGDICSGVIDHYPNPKSPLEIAFNPEKINAFLGTQIPVKTMEDILGALEFQVNLSKGTVQVPSFRKDVEMGADLAEEIARFYDYN